MKETIRTSTKNVLVGYIDPEIIPLQEQLDSLSIDKKFEIKPTDLILMKAKRTENATFVDRFKARRQDGYITTCDLLWFAIQISRAMSFLVKNKVVHRDVALRNVLLKTDFTIRVADFGLSQKFGGDGSFIQSRNTTIPFRYISPESLQNMRSSIESELWSFGVTLWELFTFAIKEPYEDLDCFSMLDYLRSGKRLQIPECSPKAVQDFILLQSNKLMEK